MTSKNFIEQVVTQGTLNGVFPATVTFKEGFNIIAGCNGTGKTKLLSHIVRNKTNDSLVKFNGVPTSKNIVPFSPKRNAQKVLIQQALQLARSENATQRALHDFLNKQIDENNFETIKSISEYLTLTHETLIEGSDCKPSEASSLVEKDYNDILSKIFDYKIKFQWNTSTRTHIFEIEKNGIKLSPADLSTGENAIISLIFAVFYLSKEADVFIIDEPEVHLNWQLEEKLFAFFDWFCSEHGKQVIIATHSRACFIEPYIHKTQFFIWESGKVVVNDRPNAEILQSLSGDIVNIVGGITAKELLIYVEDDTHKIVLDELAKLKGRETEVIKEKGGCEYVKRLSRAFKGLGVNNAFFVIDNDNQDIPPAVLSSEYLNLIQLKKYCVENYFLDEQILADIDFRTDKTLTVSSLLLQSIKDVNDPYFKIYKKIPDDAMKEPDVLDRIDASKFLPSLFGKLGYSSKKDFIEAYLKKEQEKGTLESHFIDLVGILNAKS